MHYFKLKQQLWFSFSWKPNNTHEIEVNPQNQLFDGIFLALELLLALTKVTPQKEEGRIFLDAWGSIEGKISFETVEENSK